MKNFYKINKLTLNQTKTKFTIMGTGNQINLTKNIKIKIEDQYIKCDSQVRILGSLITANNSIEPQINELIKTLSYRLHNLSNIKKITTQKTRLMFINSFIMVN